MTDTERDTLDTLRDMVIQHCHYDKGEETYDSQWISSDAYAMRLLVEYGYAEFARQPSGRSATIRLVKVISQ